MGFFGSSKPRVSKKEFKDVRSRMRSKGFSERQVDDVRMIFRGALFEYEKSQRGIDTREIAEGISWMRENMSVHSVSAEKIGLLEMFLTEEL